MNIEQFIEHYNNIYGDCGIAHTIYDSYIKIQNNLNIEDIDVTIDKVLDVHGNCGMHNYNHTITVNTPINVSCSLLVSDAITIMPGTFIGHAIYVFSNNSYRMVINGYVSQSGYIS